MIVTVARLSPMSTRVLIVDVHADIYAQHLRAECPDAELHLAKNLNELPENLSHIDVLIAFGTSINDDVLRRLTNVKWVQSLATGVDHFLRCPYLSPGVLITSGRGIHGSMMREMTVFLMLGLTHNARQQAEDQNNHVWQRRLWTLLYEKTAVVVGIGVAGTAIGELLHGFGMKVVGVSRTARNIPAFAAVIPTDRLVDAAGEADFLINVLPASPDNIGLFDDAVFAAMKPSAYFINVGRGETVDEPALIAALREKKIAGAGLDVFGREPLPPDSPLWDMPNVVITPHVGGYVAEYEDYVMPIVIENMRHFLAGQRERMRNIVARPAAAAAATKA
jgi:D-2-hydroxyacid dehydrogenase (NADP+)